MKKYTILILLLMLIITGCEDKSSKKEDYSDQKLSEITDTPIIDEDDNINKIDPEEPVKTETETETETEIETEVKPPLTCTKVFEKTYTYAYETKEQCIEKGSKDAQIVSETIDPNITSYGCEAIKDECGQLWYGVYFNTKDPETNETIRKNY